MRFVIGVVLALSVGIGAYLGSAQVAGSATAHARVVHLRIGDIAVAGQVQCRAIAESRQQPVHVQYLRCSKGPWSPATESVTVFGVSWFGAAVRTKVGHVQCDWEGLGSGPTAYLWCQKGPHAVSSVQIEVLPDGITVLHEGQTVYTTGGWGG